MTDAALAEPTIVVEHHDPPRPGVWTADRDHQSAPRGPMMQELFTPQFVEGSREWCERYGMPLDRLDGCHIDGWFYVRPVPAGVRDTGRPAPPALVLKVASRLVPEMRRRRRTAAAAVTERRWLVDADEWGAERGRWEARVADLLAVDLRGVDDPELARQLEAAGSLAREMLRRHFALLGMSVGVGRLVVACRRWGVAAADVVAALRGSSPASAGPRAGLTALAAIVGDRSPSDLAALRSLSAEAAAIVDDHLTRYGWRPLSTDLAATTLAEHPELMVDLVRASAVGSAVDATDELSRLRERVPATELPEFDRLVDEAGRCYGALDDNSGVTASTLGVLRRVLLEIGRRARARGALTTPDEVFACTSAEVTALAAGDVPATLVELAARRARLAAAAEQPPPVVIGGTPSPPPDGSVFGGALAEIATAVNAYLDLKFTPPPDREHVGPIGSLVVEGRPPVVGLGIVGGTVTGRVIVSRDPADAVARIEPGDLLVCPYTTAAHNAIFPMLGGIVTQFGGPLGHTAVMAREFGLPAVVDTGSLPLELDDRSATLTVESPS